MKIIIFSFIVLWAEGRKILCKKWLTGKHQQSAPQSVPGQVQTTWNFYGWLKQKSEKPKQLLGSMILFYMCIWVCIIYVRSAHQKHQGNEEIFKLLSLHVVSMAHIEHSENEDKSAKTFAYWVQNHFYKRRSLWINFWGLLEESKIYILSLCT